MEITRITKTDKTETMTSLEIADLVGREHKSIMRSIRDMEDDWVKVRGCKFALSQRTIAIPNGGYKEVPCYVLNKTECLYIATKFNDEARAKLVIRWEELEMKERETTGVATILNDDETIARAMTILQKRLEIAKEEKAALEQKNKTLQEDNKEKGKKILVMKPKAEYFDALVDRNMLTNFTDIAKQFGLKRKDFIERLIRDGYLYRDNKNALKPYAQYADSLFVIRDGKNENNNWAGQQTLITPKGKETFRLLYHF